ncbi:MAG: Hydroxyacid dehydrogenase [Labilithrix sp.]|nr:Hydroxyacid dehydrogenase [Labilithrix sp.]
MLRAMKIAVLDDYQGIARELADWTALERRAQVDVFEDHVVDEEALVARLAPYEVLCVMRERTPLPARVLERLPDLRLVVSTGRRNASIDMKAAEARGVEVAFTGYSSAPTIEHTWALILAGARHIVAEANAVRAGRWQHTVGEDLHGHTLAVLGLGNIGSVVAKIGGAFGMNVIAWSQNLTKEHAQSVGAELVSKEELFARADVLTIHLVLSQRTRGIVDAPALALMKRTARLVNTSRGPIVDEAALLAAVAERRIAGAAIDVFDVEPLPEGHPMRTLDGLLVTPHIGYVTRDLYRTFYGDTVARVTEWLDRQLG